MFKTDPQAARSYLHVFHALIVRIPYRTCNINNAEKAGKRQVLLRPSSKVIVKFLELMQQNGYISEFEEVDDNRGG
ncbi:uncharacterized protein FIESC28_00734 [Fusarium coffeatum]|uniref:Ribosomal protein S8 n=1 Tax=Fusarium coffeatum TaxID=231269 RepID=A0A366SCI0_9HYPO|nr:uncharacterized protein FIESC28_00734 [Fusarium coffeatum]RBR26440.1 hypothetical protein FIESC28_00734 [Fusarium coffeatum]